MPLIEQLLQIFVDQFVASLIVPMHSAYILDVVRELNPMRFAIGAIAAFLGNMLGGALSYLFGCIIANSFFTIKKSDKMNHKYKPFYFFMLLTPLNYFGGVITFLAGFGHMNKTKFFLFLAAANFIYFLIQVVLFLI